MENLNEEISKIKHLFKYKKGDVIIESETIELFNEGDILKISLPKGKTITVQLLSDASLEEVGIYYWKVKVTKSDNPKLINKTGGMEGYTYGPTEPLYGYNIFIYDEDYVEDINLSSVELLNKPIKPSEIQKIKI